MVAAAQYEFSRAAAAYVRATEISPRKYHLWIMLGDAQMERGQYQEAIVAYEKALELDPENPVAWNQRGLALRLLDSHPAALESFEPASETKSAKPESWINHAITSFELGDYDQSVHSFERACTFGPIPADSWLIYLNALAYNHEHQKVIKAGKRFIELFGPDSEVYFLLGVVRYELQQYDEAIHYFTEALKFDKDHIDAIFWYGLTLLELSRFSEAITCFEQVEDTHPGDDQAWFYHGKALVFLHEFQKAEFILKHSLQLNDQSADGCFFLLMYSIAVNYLPKLCNRWEKHSNYRHLIMLFETEGKDSDGTWIVPGCMPDVFCHIRARCARSRCAVWVQPCALPYWPVSPSIYIGKPALGKR
jgi:tetratricopeptide (TPR) repeat protein